MMETLCLCHFCAIPIDFSEDVWGLHMSTWVLNSQAQLGCAAVLISAAHSQHE